MIALPSRIIPKPAFGATCNGCGCCCTVSACRLAIQWLDKAREGEPCPALEISDERSVRGLIVRPSHHLGLGYDMDSLLGPKITELPGAGRGCDAAILENDA